MDAIEKLRQSPAQAAAALPKHLAGKSNYLAAKAAKVAADLHLTALVSDLLAALERFYEDEDKQCWAKNALVDALLALGYTESAIYVRGLKHVQREPVYGGSADTAGPLRARCAVALVECRDLRDAEVLRHLLEALTDAEKTVRVEAARAIGRIPRDEAALLLRLRALTGDKEPEVMGACFSALLGIEGVHAIEFVSQFLEKADRDEPAAGEAALALGMTRDAAVWPVLKQTWERERRNVRFAAVVLAAMALTNLPEAIEFLMARVEDGSADALEALASARLGEADRERVRKAVESDGGSRLHSLWAKPFAGAS